MFEKSFHTCAGQHTRIAIAVGGRAWVGAGAGARDRAGAGGGTGAGSRAWDWTGA